MQEPQNVLPDSSFMWMKFIPDGLSVPFELAEGIMILSDLTNHSGVKLLNAE